jgi:hypothetical protein
MSANRHKKAIRARGALLLAALAIASQPMSHSSSAPASSRPSPSAQPRGYAPRDHDDILPWARYCVATSRRRAARRGRRAGQ